ncbi:MAG TPA: response regulator [Caulobacteraceae bacterium]|jgi:signal transduction histidine kinase|nr:response regulator [Caulobacteraceae bacterium]
MNRRDPTARVLFIWLGAVVLVAASIALAFREEYAHQATVRQQAEAQTDVLAGSVGAALAFDDEASLREYLSALMRNPQVAAAAIYGPHGQQVAVLAGKNAQPPPASLTGNATQRIDGRVVVARPVVEQGQSLGAVYLQTAPERFSETIARHTALVILTLLALLLLSFVTNAAARLAGANARLSEEIEARTAAEEALRQSQKLEALGQLTGGIAHDFNNLLQAIHGAFELILGKAGDEKTVRRWAQNGIEAAERGASLTRQLLAFSRQQKLEMKPLVVAETLERMGDLLTRAIGPAVQLVFDLDTDRAPVMADATQLELAVMNLAVNARDAMPGGGRLTLRTRVVSLQRDAVLSPGRYVELQVIDTGEGMPLHIVHRAFDPFFTTKALGKGTGLGLAQVYGVARQAGGDARIASASGRGTTVTLLFREAGTAPEPAEAATRPAPKLGSATVLLVDDDDAVRGVVRGGLEMRGFKVLDADSGEAALRLAASETPQIAVVDYAMPGMDGAQTAEQLRRMLPNLPIILASGHADTAAVERVLGGSATVMRKPFDINALSDAVTRILAGP